MSQRLPQIAEYLLKAKVMDEFQIRSALAEQAKWGHRFTRAINDLRLAPEARVVQALAEAMRLQVADLETLPVDASALRKLDADYCSQKGVYPCSLKDQGKTLLVAMCDPTDFATTEEIEKKTRCRLKLLVTGESALAQAIVRGYKEARPGTVPMTAAAHAPATVGIELEAANTGEFMDAKGEVLGAIRDERRPEPRAPTRSAPPPPVPVAYDAGVSSELDALFGLPSQSFTPEELQRLEAVRQNQARGRAVFRAVLELCVEKGFISQAELAKLKF